MLFRVIQKDGLKRLFELLVAENTVIGPVEIGTDRHGLPIHGFSEVFDFHDVRLDYKTTKLPAKQYFLPFREDLATFRLSGKDWDKEVDYHSTKQHVFFGLHACDINALNKLDKVLLGGAYPMPYYAAKRQNMFIIGIDCLPQPYCFCRSMGSDTALHGFDMFITDLGGSYFVEILSDTAFNLLKQVESREPVEEDQVSYQQVVADKNKKFTTHVDTTDLTKILDMEFQSEVWKYWGDKCLSCGTCANVCPTCYCYTVHEQVDVDLSRATKTKMLYSCNFIDFAEVAGGHNFRPERHGRLKYRYYHKHRGFVEAYEESLCVGCGRCGESCLAEITVPEVISSVRGGTI
ncbi:MAG: 4Fe-4S dicluster domain-containing protein [Proteobacteria bacterium]|nr:hydrogenase [Desulfobulbaceae bacterium]MBU4154092.1 4Fe-4S dicluster domain-containing protein [Pseudomonadota bacterium]MDP2107074.1 4Fe-4S dicluster domain-containing protein [Desulfobulbaceae bacterium]